MRITDVKVSVSTREIPPMAHRDHVGSEPWDMVVIRVLTDEGVEGNAFGWGVRSGEVTAKIVADVLKPALVGEDPFDREKIWQKIRTLDRWLAFFPLYAQGPMDVALWDIAAKKAGLPLYKLIGGYREKVRAYATAAWSIPDVESYKRQADEVLAMGFTAYKMTAWGDPDYDIPLMREMRAYVGDGVDLMLDCVSAYDHRTALKVGRVAEELGFYWFEEPLWTTTSTASRSSATRSTFRWSQPRRSRARTNRSPSTSSGAPPKSCGRTSAGRAALPPS